MNLFYKRIKGEVTLFHIIFKNNWKKCHLVMSQVTIVELKIQLLCSTGCVFSFRDVLFSVYLLYFPILFSLRIHIWLEGLYSLIVSFFSLLEVQSSYWYYQHDSLHFKHLKHEVHLFEPISLALAKLSIFIIFLKITA